jgi:hydrogenase expression/formation protein HypC
VLNHVGYAIRRIPPEEIGETLELYESLMAAAEEDGQEDLMAADIRGEIAAAVAGKEEDRD